MSKSEDERLKEVDRQLEAMRVAIGEDNWSDSDSDTDDSEQLQERTGKNAAMESARKFLWDEVDEEDDHLYLGGPFPKKATAPSYVDQSPQAKSGANMFRPTIWDSQRGSGYTLDDSINLMDASERHGGGDSKKKPAANRPSLADMFFRGGRKAPTKAASASWYDAEARDADDYLDRKIPKKGKAWSYLACLWNFVLWSILLGCTYVFGYYIYDFVKTLRPAQPEPVGAADAHAAAVQKALTKHGILLENRIADKKSPQSAALEWLIQDTMETYTKAKDPYLVQRYALAVIYYSTGGQDWTNSDGWMTKAGYCQWYGVQCLGKTDEIESHHGNGPIFELNLSSNNAKGNLPAELNGLQDLFFLNLQDNQLEGTIPHDLGGWTALRMFSVAHNELYGSIPPTLLSTSPDLRILNAGFNGLTGTIPPEIGDASNLREVRLEFNGLYGHLPDSLRNLDRVETLHLAGNKLGGSLPSGIYDMDRLETLYLHDNVLTGRLSNEFAQLSHLELLTLNNNQFAGTVPNVFSQIRHLQEAHLHANLLSGTMPPSMCALRTIHKLSYLSVDCTKTDEANEMGVRCECCSDCK